MTQKENGGPAYPTVAGQTVYSSGMSLRDWFAGQMLAGMCGHPKALRRTRDDDLLSDAILAYRYADAMIEARNK